MRAPSLGRSPFHGTSIGRRGTSPGRFGVALAEPWRAPAHGAVAGRALERERAGPAYPSRDWTRGGRGKPAAVSDLLAIYLQDHLAGATFGVELVRRAHRENEGSELGEFLELLAAEIERDRDELAALMDRLGVEPDPLKSAGAWVAEKVGRLKRNGSTLSYSPLSRVVELEWLIAGVSGKRALWQALLERSGRDERLDPQRLEGLIAAADSQLAGLHQHHRAAV